MMKDTHTYVRGLVTGGSLVYRVLSNVCKQDLENDKQKALGSLVL